MYVSYTDSYKRCYAVDAIYGMRTYMTIQCRVDGLHYTAQHITHNAKYIMHRVLSSHDI